MERSSARKFGHPFHLTKLIEKLSIEDQILSILWNDIVLYAKCLMIWRRKKHRHKPSTKRQLRSIPPIFLTVSANLLLHRYLSLILCPQSNQQARRYWSFRFLVNNARMFVGAQFHKGRLFVFLVLINVRTKLSDRSFHHSCINNKTSTVFCFCSK